MAKLKQSLQQKLQQKLSPQQIQVIRLLEIPTLQLEERVKRELEENPTLEEGAPDGDLEASAPAEEHEADEGWEEGGEDNEFSVEDYLDLDDDYAMYPSHGTGDADEDPTLRTEQRYAEATTFRDSLLEQIRFRRADKETLALAEYIVGNLDADGYLRRDLRTMADDILLTLGYESRGVLERHRCRSAFYCSWREAKSRNVKWQDPFCESVTMILRASITIK